MNKQNSYSTYGKTVILKINSRTINFFYNLLIAPRSTTDETQRKEYILNITQLSALILLAWADFHIFLSLAMHDEAIRVTEVIPFSAFTLLTVIFISLYVLSRSGYVLVSSYLTILLFLAGAGYGTVMWGFDLPASLLSFSLIIILSSILINSRFGLLIAANILIALTSISRIEHHYHIVSTWKTQVVTSTDGVVYGLLLLVIAVISWLSAREIEKSLSRARTSEAELFLERDLLEIKIEERTKNLKTAQLEKVSSLSRFAEFGRLSSGLFHDLVNPLTAVSLSIQRLENCATPNFPDIQEHINQAVLASHRMEQFMENVRRHLQDSIDESVFSLNEEIEQAIEILRYRSRVERVKLIFPDCPIIQTTGYALKFYQVAANLIGNAIDSYYEQTNQNSERVVIISLRQENNRVHFCVTDHGRGIKDAVVNRIFEPFFTTKHPSRGTGLGLMNVKSIIENEFSGHILLKSQVGKGSTFEVIFPIHHGASYQHSYENSLHENPEKNQESFKRIG